MRFAERTARTGWERLTVSATLALDEIDSRPTIVSSTLEVRALVSGLGEAEFQSAVAEAADLCPVSRLFTGADVTVSSAALVVALGIGQLALRPLPERSADRLHSDRSRPCRHHRLRHRSGSTAGPHAPTSACRASRFRLFRTCSSRGRQRRRPPSGDRGAQPHSSRARRPAGFVTNRNNMNGGRS